MDNNSQNTSITLPFPFAVDSMGLPLSLPVGGTSGPTGLDTIGNMQVPVGSANALAPAVAGSGSGISGGWVLAGFLFVLVLMSGSKR